MLPFTLQSSQKDTSPTLRSRINIPLFLGAGLALFVAFVWYFLYAPPTHVLYKDLVENPHSTNDLLTLQSAKNDALEFEIERLKRLLTGNICTDAGMPLEKTPLMLPPLSSDEGQNAPQATPPIEINPQKNKQVPQYNGSVEPVAPPFTPPTTVADLLAQGTVLVFCNTSEGFAFGTGFFVSPGVVLTNRHVISKSASRAVFVSNPTLGGVVSAEILDVSTSPKQDYAILQVAGKRAQEIRPLVFTTKIARTDRVSAWGYPGLLVEVDPQFLALYKGDSSAAPEVTYSEGVVSVVMRVEPPAVIHTADLSQGNSGGPLVDAKGRVVAINTLIRFTDDSHRQTSISLASSDIVPFLQSKKIPVTVDND